MPANERSPMMFACDCCNAQVRRLHHVEAYGLETFACDECAGHNPADYGEEDDDA